MPLARNVATVGTATLLSRLLGFFRDVGIAAVLGAGPFSEAFFAMLQVVNFFRRFLAEGALNSAFVPLWLRLRSGENGAGSADRFTKRTLVAIGCVTGIVALLGIVFAPAVAIAIAPGFDEGRQELTTFYLFIAAPYIVLAGLVAVIAAALNAEKRVGAVAISTVAFNLVILLALASALGELDQFLTGVWLAAAIVVAGLIQLIVVAAAWLLTGNRWRRVRVRVPDQTRQLFVRVVPGLVAAGIPQLKLIAAAAIASSSPAAVSWLYYANRLYELPLGVASVAIAVVIVPLIAASVRDGRARDIAATQSRAFEIALGLALPAAVAFLVLAESIAGGLFERGAFGPRDTAAVAGALAAIAAGLPGHVLEKVFGAVSFAHEDTRTPMLAALCGLAAAVAGALLLFPRYGHVGVAAAIAISAWVGAGILAVVLARRRWLRLEGGAWQRLLRIVLASGVMGVAIGAAQMAPLSLFGIASPGLARAVTLMALVALGFGVYLASLQILGVARLSELSAAIRRRW
jgi:putative peptidoglycan lipid II flippase